MVFCAPLTLEAGRSLYAALKDAAAEHGRGPDAMRIMPGLSPVIGRTEAEAAAKHEALQAMIHPIVAREMLSTVLGGIDLSGHDLDGPLPDLPETTEGSQFIYRSTIDLARREKLTIRQLALRVSGSRGKSVVKGTPAGIADHMQEWFEGGAADGFNIMPPTLPGGLDDFVDLVIPELQRRGLFRTEYEGTTLRGHLGLARPANRHAAGPVAEPEPA